MRKQWSCSIAGAYLISLPLAACILHYFRQSSSFSHKTPDSARLRRPIGFLFVFPGCLSCICGWRAFSWRSALMVMLIMLLMRFRIKLPIIDSISIVFILLLVLDPHYLIPYWFPIFVSSQLGSCYYRLALYTGSFIERAARNNPIKPACHPSSAGLPILFLESIVCFNESFRYSMLYLYYYSLLLLISILLYPSAPFCSSRRRFSISQWISDSMYPMDRWCSLYPWVTGASNWYLTGLFLVLFYFVLLGRRAKKGSLVWCFTHLNSACGSIAAALQQYRICNHARYRARRCVLSLNCLIAEVFI